MKWIDTHTHLEHDYPFSVDEYLERSRKAGVYKFITIGTRPESQTKLREFADKYPDVYFSVGIHPHEAKDYTPAVEATLTSLISHPKCVGVGETGLDYYYNHSAKDVQLSALEAQLALAIRNKKPVIIHARDAEADLLPALSNYAAKTVLKDRPGVIHCFSGTAEFAKSCVDLGFYISFSGILTFKTAHDLRVIAKSLPADRILLETDSPFLAPVPFRGKPNLSEYMVETARVLATARDWPLERLSKTTCENAERLFQI